MRALIDRAPNAEVLQKTLLLRPSCAEPLTGLGWTPVPIAPGGSDAPSGGVGGLGGDRGGGMVEKGEVPLMASSGMAWLNTQKNVKKSEASKPGKGCPGFLKSGICQFPGHCQFGCANAPAAIHLPADATASPGTLGVCLLDSSLSPCLPVCLSVCLYACLCA